jgi:hypothetical protein
MGCISFAKRVQMSGLSCSLQLLPKHQHALAKLWQRLYERDYIPLALNKVSDELRAIRIIEVGTEEARLG